MRYAAVLVMLMVSATSAADELAVARKRLASRHVKDRLSAIQSLVRVDNRAAIDALDGAVKKSALEMDRLAKRLDKIDLEWERAVDKMIAMEKRGKDGTDAYRVLSRKESRLHREWLDLNADARLHLRVVIAAGDAFLKFSSAEAIAAIEKGARSSPHPVLRMLYIAGLRNETRKRSIPLLLELMDHRDPRVRAMAVRTLGPFALDSRVTTRIAALGEEPSWAVRRGAYEVMARAHLAVGVPFLISGARSETGEIRQTIFAYLQHMTGASVAETPGAWDAWFEENRQAIRAGTYEKPDGTLSEALADETRSVPTFFRIPIESTNVIFAIDFSGSMQDRIRIADKHANRIIKKYDLSSTRLGYAKAELIGALQKLPDGARFNIVAYSDRGRFLSPRMKIATDGTRAAAIKWLLRTRTGTLTNLWDGLHLSYNNYLASSGGLRFRDLPDTIVFLTDGNATRGRFRDTHSLRRLVRLWNMPLDTVIHCVGIGRDHDRILLKALADQTGGFYVDLQRGFDASKPRRRKMPPR